MNYSIAVLLSLFLSCSGYAVNYEGSVSLINSQTHMVDSATSKSIPMSGQSPAISLYLNRLSQGDFISVEGAKNTSKTLLSVNSINYVGLRALLGTWSGDDSFCYSFTSFTEFSMTQKIGKKCMPKKLSSYVYTVNPTSRSWVILVSSDMDSFIGDLNILGPSDVELKLYDSNTGEIIRDLHLKK